MSALCPHCDHISRVVLTRYVHGVQARGDHGRNHRTTSHVRTRQCLKCRYKWKTVEIMMPRRIPKDWRIET